MMSKLCQDARNSLVEGIEAFNKALKEENLVAMNAASANITKAEDEYAKQAELDLFSAHKDDECPVKGILAEGFYGIIKHKDVKVDGTLVKCELNEDVEKQVSMKKMFQYLGVTSMQWYYRIERLTELLAEATCDDVGKSTSGMKDVFKMSKAARELNPGANPTSNSSMLKFLQSCVDLIINIPDADGNNTVRVNNRDLKFLKHSFTKAGSGRLDLNTSRATGVVTVIGKIIYRVLNDFAYDVKFKTIQESNPTLEAQRAANRKAKAEKEKAEAAQAAPTTEEVVVIAQEKEAV